MDLVVPVGLCVVVDVVQGHANPFALFALLAVLPNHFVGNVPAVAQGFVPTRLAVGATIATAAAVPSCVVGAGARSRVTSDRLGD